MDVDSLSYERMVENALRGVLRQALEITAAQGLPGQHHFYITFDTTNRDVQIPASLKALHPNEMTIVLQHQFWDLKVSEEHFEVTLSFSGVSQRLSIPFAAVTAFADPHAKFGLQFHVEFEEQEEAEGENDDDAGDPPLDEAMPIDSSKVSKHLKTGRKAAPPPQPSLSVVKPAAEKDGTGNVVTLDAFRKK